MPTNTPTFPDTSPNYVETARSVIIVGGDGGTLAQTTEDGEIWTTTTERENDVFAVYQTSITGTGYVILASRLNPQFPHIIQGQNTNRLDITSLYYSLDVPANGEGSIQIGVITRIDGTNADIKYVMGIPFFNAAKTVIVDSLRGVPSQVKFEFNGDGVLQNGVTNITETNVAAVNTGTNLDSPIGNIPPGLGDIILKFNHTVGITPFTIFAFYHGH